MRRLNAKPQRLQFELRSSPTRRYFYFGYDSEVTFLTIKEGKKRRHFFPELRVHPDDQVSFVDIGILVWLPFGDDHPFGRDARHLIVVAGCHRLATGIGSRFVENGELREKWLGPEADFRSTGRIAFRVNVRGASSFESSGHPPLETFEVLAANFTM